jgi:hypothetical protein
MTLKMKTIVQEILVRGMAVVVVAVEGLRHKVN